MKLVMNKCTLQRRSSGVLTNGLHGVLVPFFLGVTMFKSCFSGYTLPATKSIRPSVSWMEFGILQLLAQNLQQILEKEF